MKSDVEITSLCNCISLHTNAWFQNIFSSTVFSLPSPKGVIYQPGVSPLDLTIEASQHSILQVGRCQSSCQNLNWCQGLCQKSQLCHTMNWMSLNYYLMKKYNLNHQIYLCQKRNSHSLVHKYWIVPKYMDFGSKVILLFTRTISGPYATSLQEYREIYLMPKLWYFMECPI